MSFQWTPETTNTAVSLWNDGNSATEIAARFQGAVTRNAVLGKLYRMGLMRNEKRFKTPVIRNIREKRKKAIAAKKAPEPTLLQRIVAKPAEPHQPPKRLVGLMDLEEHHCRYPFTQQDGTHLFCGRNKVVGLPYCEDCARVCFKVQNVTNFQAAAPFELALAP